MGLADLNKRLFDAGVRSRGEGIFRSRGVRDVAQTQATIHAKVRSSSGAGNYDVEIRLTPNRKDVDDFECSCPYSDGGAACKHIWAALRHIDAYSGRIDSAANVPAVSQTKTIAAGKAATSSPRKPIANVAGKATGGIQSAQTPEWRTVLSQLTVETEDDIESASPCRRQEPHRGQSFWYIVNVDSTLNGPNITIDLMTQQMRGNGEPGAIKEYRLDQNELSRVLDQEHRLLLADLYRIYRTDSGYNYSWQIPATSQFTLRPLMQQAVLPKLAETGRLCWRLSSQVPVEDVRFVTLEKDAYWEPSIEFVRKPDSQEWIITGRLIQKVYSSDDVQQVRPLTDLLWLNQSGLAMFPETLSNIRVRHQYGWLQLLRRRAELRVPFSDHAAFVAQILATPALREMPLPADFCPCRTDVACQPRLRLASYSSLHHEMRHRPFVFGTVDFLYDGHSVSTNEPSPVIGTGAAMIRRDSFAESSHLKSITDLGANTFESFDEFGDVNVQLPDKQANSILMKLLESNWEVEAEGGKVKWPGVFRMGVSSSLDWFDLNGELDFDGISATLPELLRAAQAGDEFIKLSDGTRGMLPEKWLQRYSTLISLGEVDGDAVRFKPSQAMILDAMLEAQENATRDRDFKAYCKKLREFSGIKQKPAPKTFKGELRDYQKDGLSWLSFLNEFRLGGCLADDMGLGKTVQVLALLEARRTRRLKADDVRRPSLVVVPKSLIFNWIKEAQRFAPQLKVVNHTGLLRHGNELSAADVIITTYGTLRMDIVTIEKLHFDYIILDEAQAIKNSDSQSAKVCRLLKSDFRLAMTGTPVENHLGELWSLFEFLNPGMLGASSAFQRLTSSRDEEEEERAAALGMISKALRPFMLRRTKTQVLKDLPGKTEQTLFCEMPPKQKKLYNELKKFYQAQLKNKIQEVGLKRSKIHVLEALLRLRQAACHPGLIDPKRAKEESGKMEAVLEQLTQIAADGHKALVFSQFTSLLDIVRRRLDKENICYAYLDGKTTKRQQVVENFQSDPNCPLFLISLKAGGHGLNLTAADYVFILDPWWNPAVEAQAVDRVHRMGQDRHVFAYRLISKDTVEERILEMQKEKRALAEAVISADASLISSLTAEDLAMLLS